ncbi:hypothetical protein [Sphingomonas colocasiae]|uniref:Energy transducer TonB n=1 Tax=Sphingomonas colocasiae TaxID=1848973 RepID=A0ABS7PU45_9SPHN|nr:hypothetical protein [Sphingomonas colocasiae]MBY8824877.1 hypothetical protein [Sphingomonas colocasiae]
MISSAIRLSPLLALALAACGSGQKNDQALNALDRSLAGNAVNAQDVDPALAASLEDQIMVDPSLSAQANRDSVRPPAEPMRAPVPADGPATANVGTGKLLSAPKAVAMDAPEAPTTLGALASQQARRAGQSCGAELGYSQAWATRLPADLPLFPQARVTEAAGSDAGGCRAVSFTSGAALQTVLDYYYTQAVRGGFTAEHRVDGGEHTLGGTRGKDDGAFVVIARARPGGGTEVDLITNNGR